MNIAVYRSNAILFFISLPSPLTAFGQELPKWHRKDEGLLVMTNVHHHWHIYDCHDPSHTETLLL